MVVCGALGAAATATPVRVGAAAAGTGITVSPPATPSFAGDAPDPDVVRNGSETFAFSTGTGLASYLQVLCTPDPSPTSGWVPCHGFPFGASALPLPPAWEALGTQNSPGVYEWHGTWILFYTAARAGHADDTGANCLSVATRPDLTASDPAFADTSDGTWLCDASLGGAIDPAPFVDPATGQPYLVWKTSDRGSPEPARLWAQPLGPDGTSLVGHPELLQLQDVGAHPFEGTIENPQMIAVGGAYYLLFSTGTWSSASYGETAVECAGPLGPCDEPAGGPFLGSYGDVVGPGGGMFFQDPTGAWQLAYAAWSAGCTAYACGGSRDLYVAPATIAPFPLDVPVTGMAARTDGGGYWLVNAQGGVSAHGTAVREGSMLGLALDAPVEHLVATPDDKGYWMVAADGGIFAFGDAPFFGSMGGRPLNAPVVDLAPTPDGGGYWLVAADGGVFAFGDAAFRGSMGAVRLNRPVVGISADPTTGGYWLVASDGGIFAFDAPFDGSTGAITLARPVEGMAATPDGGGYWLVASDGGVFAFGDAAFRGSAGGQALDSPVTGMAADPATGGYWLVTTDGQVLSFGAPSHGSD